MKFSDILINWFNAHKRDLPWRKTNDAYKIWVSEIILQQTRIEQGTKYYHNFLNHFPDINTLALTDIDKVLKVWQGLGYYTRAINMHHAAKQIVEKYNGVFPCTYEELIKIKGIGRYTASAILSFAYSKPYPVLDGNVKRVLSRVYAYDKDPNSQAAEKYFYKILEKLIDRRKPSEFNQAIMEFGAIHCKSKSPKCYECVFQNNCKANLLNKVDTLPAKKTKNVLKKRYFWYLVFLQENNKEIHTILEKRNNKDIWKNLYQFPLIETKTKYNPEEFIKNNKDLKRFLLDAEIIDVSKPFMHKLSHQNIEACFIKISVKKLPTIKKTKPIELHKIHLYPIPRLIEKYITENF